MVVLATGDQRPGYPAVGAAVVEAARIEIALNPTPSPGQRLLEPGAVSGRRQGLRLCHRAIARTFKHVLDCRAHSVNRPAVVEPT